MQQGTTQQAVLFPGQGSQDRGMGRDIAEYSREAMELWKKAEKAANASLREIYWDGDDEAMTETRYQQPALTVVALSTWSVLPGTISPRYLAGHSIGEYAALGAAGVLDVGDVLDLVALRGRLMSEAGQSQAGAMAAVLKMKPETVQEIVDRAAGETGEELRIANYNTPAQLVVSGTVQAVQRACDLVKENKGRAVSLPVSGAFHSNLMQEAADELAGFMARLNWSDARIPIHLNVTATPESGSEAILDSLKKQMVSPVLWSQTIQDQWDRGVTQWYELGPKGVLTRMMRHILQAQEGWQADTVESLEKARSMAGSSTNAPGE